MEFFPDPIDERAQPTARQTSRRIALSRLISSFYRVTKSISVRFEWTLNPTCGKEPIQQLNLGYPNFIGIRSRTFFESHSDYEVDNFLQESLEIKINWLSDLGAYRSHPKKVLDNIWYNNL